MKKKLIVVTLIIISIFTRANIVKAQQVSAICSNQVNLVPEECQALINFFIINNFTHWDNRSGWLTNSDSCTWYGVTCANGHVIELDLHNNNLGGDITSAIGEFPFMKVLNLSGNGKLYQVPRAIGNLHNLEILNLNGNRMVGAIPSEWGQLSNLIKMDIGGNFLGRIEGSFPASFANLLSLEYLDFHGNLIGKQLSPKPGFPMLLTTLTNLVHLDLGGNYFTGEIPAEIGNLSQLTYLNLGDSKYLGRLPIEFFYLVNLKILDLSSNPSLIEINPEFGNLVELEELWLDHCGLTGIVPSSIGNLTNLKKLFIGYNSGLSGAIPPSIGNLINLELLNISFANFTSIPEEVLFLDNLLQFNANNNKLSSLPAGIGGLEKIEILSFKNNQLNSIPEEIWNLDSLLYLDLSNNQVNESLPSDIGNMANLRGLSLQFNNINGLIPDTLFFNPNIVVITLHNNNFSGPIPSTIGNATQLKTLFVFNNQLSGELPLEIGNASNLITLHLENNIGLTGYLPATLTSLNKLSGLLYQNTDLCTPQDSVFQNWLAGVGFVRPSGLNCPSNQQPVADFSILGIEHFEGEPVEFDVSNSYDPEDGFISSFSHDYGDGSLGDGPLDIHVYINDGSFEPKLFVYDSEGLEDQAQRILVIKNVAPVIESTLFEGIFLPGGQIDFSLTFYDPGKEDLHTSMIDWGDGTSSDIDIEEFMGNGTISSSHVYETFGNYLVSIYLSDEVETTYYQEVIHINSPIEGISNLIEYVEELSIGNGKDNSLSSILESVYSNMTDNNEKNDESIANKIIAFIHAVEAQSGKKINDGDASILIEYANIISDYLSTVQ